MNSVKFFLSKILEFVKSSSLGGNNREVFTNLPGAYMKLWNSSTEGSKIISSKIV
jgi:hypothetical protein